MMEIEDDPDISLSIPVRILSSTKTSNSKLINEFAKNN